MKIQTIFVEAATKDGAVDGLRMQVSLTPNGFMFVDCVMLGDCETAPAVSPAVAYLLQRHGYASFRIVT